MKEETGTVFDFGVLVGEGEFMCWGVQRCVGTPGVGKVIATPFSII